MLALAFYKADSRSSEGNGHLLDKAIGLWTRGPFSHVELVYGRDIDNEHLKLKDAMCFSSSPRDGGTRAKLMDLNDGKWEVVDIPATFDQWHCVYEWCRKQQGKGYDYPGVFGFVCWPFVRQDPKRWFCSEITVAALQQIGMFEGVKPHTVSPNRLARMVGLL